MSEQNQQHEGSFEQNDEEITEISSHQKQKDSEARANQHEENGQNGDLLGERVRELEEQCLRLSADLQNVRRRSGQEKESIRLQTQEDILKNMLLIKDHLEMGLAHPDGQEGLRTGIELTLKQFEQILQQYSVREIKAKGEVFDPHLHEALQKQKSDTHEPGVVIQEVQKGYQLGERLLRPARVIVADES